MCRELADPLSDRFGLLTPSYDFLDWALAPDYLSNITFSLT